MTLSQFIVNITFAVLIIIFIFLLTRVIRANRFTLELLIDGIFLIGVFGWIVQIMSYKNVIASLPALIVLVVLMIKIIRNNKKLDQLKVKKYDFQVQSKKPKQS